METTVRTPAILEARGVCMLSTVASAMASSSATAGDMPAHPPTLKTLTSRYIRWLVDQARTGELILCDSTGVPCTWSELTEQNVGKNFETDTSNLWVTLHHLNKWGEANGRHFKTTSKDVAWFDERGQLGGTFNGNIDVHHLDGTTTTITPPLTVDEPIQRGPTPLTSSEIASCFHGFLNRTDKSWKLLLANKPKWLESSCIGRGTQGGPGATWDPISFGAALINEKDVKVKSVRAKFQTSPRLHEWQEAWMQYETEWLPADT